MERDPVYLTYAHVEAMEVVIKRWPYPTLVDRQLLQDILNALLKTLEPQAPTDDWPLVARKTLSDHETS